MANDVKLQEGHPVDENLRPIKIGGEPTALEVSKDDVRVKNFKVSGTHNVSDDTKLPLAGGTLTGSVTASSDFRLNGLGNIYIDSADEIILDSADGQFLYQVAGDEFSVANSAFAGLILGYRCIGEDATPVTYTLTTSMVTIHADATVRFVAPPSGNVEVNFQAHYYGGNGSTITLGLSEDATYSAISAPSAQYEKVSFDVARFDDAILNQNWVVTGLTPNTTYNYWVGAKTSSTSGTPTIKYGGDSAGENVPLIIKVTALPHATTHFAVYG